MQNIRREPESDWQPRHDEIEYRAYGIYLERNREEGHAMEHWLLAEEELRQAHARQHEPVPLKSKTVVAGPGGIAKSSIDA